MDCLSRSAGASRGDSVDKPSHDVKDVIETMNWGRSISQEAALIQFARQLSDACLERYGKDHEQTRLASKYLEGLTAESTMIIDRPLTSELSERIVG
jgi:hypothetical protein